MCDDNLVQYRNNKKLQHVMKSEKYKTFKAFLTSRERKKNTFFITDINYCIKVHFN